MFGFLSFFYEYYYVVIVLQAICVFHCVRKGKQQNWIWLIVFLPVIGCIAYVFTEIIKQRHVSTVQSGVVSVINPGGRISDLEKRFKFSNTFTNRVALADAHLENKNYQQAIELYEPGLTGMHDDNEHVIKNLISAYHHLERFDDIVKIAPKAKKSVDFSKSRANLLYALALEHTGNISDSEREYQGMNHRYSNFEARYFYGDFLLRNERTTEALEIFQEVVNEGSQMNRREKGEGRIWIEKAGHELNTLQNRNS
jgi:hypothetical protein